MANDAKQSKTAVDPCEVPLRVSAATRCKVRTVAAIEGRKLHKVVEIMVDEYVAAHGIDVRTCAEPAKPEVIKHPALEF
jgi:hypothetical protein